MLTTGFFAFVVTVLFMLILRPVAKELRLVDVPGGRKRHGVEVPLTGGLAMSIGVGLASSFASQPSFFVPTLLAIYLLVFVGTIDDRYDLPPSVRLVAQAVAAMLVVFGAGIQVTSLEQAFFVTTQLGPFAALFTLLFIVTLINAFNVIDGIDGLAGGLSLISLISLAIIGTQSDVFGLAVVCASTVAGFLLFNFPLGFNRKLRSFMGDAGSTFLGLAIAAIGISITQNPVANVSPVVGLWIVAVPVYDLFSAAIRRILAGKSPFTSDHEHLHHALMERGLSVRTTLAFMLLCAFVAAGLGLAGHYANAHDGFLLTGWLGGLALYYQAMRRPGRVVRAIQAVVGTLTVQRTVG